MNRFAREERCRDAKFSAGSMMPQRTTYVLDVRTAEEFAAGSVPGAVHAPGGQLVQATDQWVGVRNATIVLIDSEAVRAPVVATWLKQLGFDAYVLQEGASATLRVPGPPTPDLPALTPISPAELKNAADAGTMQRVRFASEHEFPASARIRQSVDDSAADRTGRA